MTKVKLCGMMQYSDIQTANALHPEYVGFIFAKKSKRYITPATAAEFKKELAEDIQAVGVFVNETPEQVAALLQNQVIDVAQLHGTEDEAYIQTLRSMTEKPIIKAFRIDSADDVARAVCSSADHILLDAGNGGTGNVFDWSLLEGIQRPYFLAGGLGVDNVADAMEALHPYAVDVSSGIETDGKKDHKKMTAFVEAVRKGE